MSLETFASEMLREDLAHETSDITIISVETKLPIDSRYISANSHGNVMLETIKPNVFDETGLMNKESDYKYIEHSCSEPEVVASQIELKKETDELAFVELGTEDKHGCADMIEEAYNNIEAKSILEIPEVAVTSQFCDLVCTKQESTEPSGNGIENKQPLDTVYLRNPLEWKEPNCQSLDIQGLCNLEAVTEEYVQGLKTFKELDARQYIESDSMKQLLELKVESSGEDGSYVKQEIEDEVVLGPVVLTRPAAATSTIQEVPVEFEPGPWEIPIHYEVKEEPSRSGYVDAKTSGLLGGVYLSHEVKSELEQQPEMYKQEPRLAVWGSCSVRLERVAVDRRRRTCRVGRRVYPLRGPIAYRTGFAFDLGQARQAIQNKLNLTAVQLFSTTNSTDSKMPRKRGTKTKIKDKPSAHRNEPLLVRNAKPLDNILLKTNNKLRLDVVNNIVTAKTDVSIVSELFKKLK